MADISASNWSETDASNTTAAPDGAPEGMAPSGVNDTMRAMIGAVKRFWDRINGTLSSAGSSTAYTLTHTVAVGSIVTGERFCFKIDETNTGASTLAIDGLTAKNIYKPTTAGPAALAAGDLVIGNFAEVAYDGTQYVLLSVAPTAALAAGTGIGVSGGTVSIAAAYRAIGVQTIWVPAAAMVSSATNGPSSASNEMATNKNMVRTLDFDATTSESAQFEIAMPKGWDEGTITFIPYWTGAAGAGTAIWGLQAVATSDDDALDVAFGTAQTSSDTFITANDLHVGPESSAITIGGTPAAGDRVNFKVYRDVADTRAVDNKLIGIKVLYTTDTANDT